MSSLKSRALSLLTLEPALYRLALRVKGTLTLEPRAFSRLVRPGDTVFDIGANRGRFTLIFSMLAGERGQVHAFEPVPPTFERLSTYIRSEAVYANTQLVPVGASDSAGRFTIYLPGGDDGQASLRRQEEGSWKDCAAPTEYLCDTMRIDDYVSEHRIERLDFVKCDVEGAELLALRGMTAALRKWTPSLYVEANPSWSSAFGYSLRDVWDLLRSLGYEHTFHVDTSRAEPVLMTESELARLGPCSNFLSISPARFPCPI